MTPLFGLLASLLIALALSLTVYVLSEIPSAARPELGNRGLKRRQALAEGGLFASFDPLLRRLAGWSAALPLHGLREGLERRLLWSGYFLGVTADEALVMSVAGAVLGVVVGSVWAHWSRASFMWVAMASCLGALGFSLVLDLETRRRRKEIDRQLPPAIDLLSLCVGAGSDFPAGVRFVLGDSAPNSTLRAELTHLLQELELGHTRQKALRGLSERLPTEAVRDFVNAVIQAEEKGNPLAEVLEIQARMLRMRRSVLAEEAAAKAGVRLLLPLVLLMLCIMLILFGSLMIKGMSGGL
jgi:tight adherence protein C